MNICKSCGTPLIKKETKRKVSQLKQHYYYTVYYFCSKEQKIYHSDEFKVENKKFDLFTRHILVPKIFDVEIWTDGASRHNGQEHARAAWAFVSGDYEASGLVEGKQTNNRGEAWAIFHGLKWAGEKGYKHIKIYTDSQITIHGVLKAFHKVKENQDIFARIAEVVQDNNLSVTYEKVLGHSGDTNNERADKLANFLAGIPQKP